MDKSVTLKACPVEQVDRDLVISLMRPLARTTLEHAALDFIADGRGDDAPAVQLVARHRSEAQATGLRADEQALKDLASLPDDLASLVRHHIREMYPNVLKAAPSTFQLSVGNTVRNRAHSEVTAFLAALEGAERHG